MTKKKPIYHIFYISVVFIAIAVTILPFLGVFEYYADFLEQARFHVLIGIALLFVVFLLLKRIFYALLLFFVVISNLFIVFGAYELVNPPVVCEEPQKSGDLRVLGFNIFKINKNYSDIVSVIRESDADIVVLQEAQYHLLQNAKNALSVTYPFYYPNKGRISHSMGIILSKHPITSVKTIEIPGTKKSITEAYISYNNQSIRVINYHAKSPKSKERMSARNYDALRLSEYIRRSADESVPFIIAGDFNNVPWHRTMKAFKKQAALTYIPLYEAVGTWPEWLPPFIRVPIDHIYFNGRLFLLEYGALPSAGSDHIPVYADFKVCY